MVGKVARIADGDTLTVVDSQKVQYKIRLEGIDAPESHQAFGTKSREALAGKVFGKTVTVRWHKKDQYGRILGKVYLDGRDINREIVAEGWAWHYGHYSNSKELAEAEAAARRAKAGLWADKDPMPPWAYRRNERAQRLEAPRTRRYRISNP